MATRSQGQTQKATAKGKQKKGDDLNQSEIDTSHPDSDMKSKIDDISTDIKELKNGMIGMLKKEDIEVLVTKTITEAIRSFEERMKDEIKRQVKEKCEKLENVIESLQYENNQLKDKMEKDSKEMENKTNELESRIKENETQTRDALKMSNYNEQYSRKNNIKIMNVEEEENESVEMLTESVLSILSKKGVDLRKEEILALHRLPTRTQPRRPVIIKTTNNNVKSRVMRKRKEMRTAGYRIADDVTRLNTGLISRLNNNDNIDSAWFFNGSVFGRTTAGQRLKFDLYDDINLVISENVQAILNHLLGLNKDIYNGTSATGFGPRDAYDSSIAPDFELDYPTKVKIKINIQNIYSVSESSMDYSLDLKLMQSWADRRLNYADMVAGNSKLKMLELDSKLMHKVWVPDTYFANEKFAKVHEVTVPNKMMHLFENGTVHYKIRLSLTLSCGMKLHKYPLDEQVCPIVIESYAYTTENVQFEWGQPHPIIIMQDLTLPQFEPKLGDIMNCSDHYVAGNFACLQTTIILQRKVGYYVVQVFIPSVLIVVLSWVSFWVDHDAAAARISLGVLTVLTMTTQSSGSRQSLPHVSYVKAIDVWMSTCLMFVFVALLEYSYVNVLARRNFKTKAEKRETPMELQQLLVNNTDDSLAEKKPETNCKKCKPRRMLAARKVDKISRAVFPSVFLLFNIAFWTYYTFVPNP